MQKEEMVLFPYIKELVASNRADSNIELSHFGSVQNPISMMETEHEKAGDILKEIGS